MMKRCQYITKLQSELIQEKKLLDLKLDEAIAKHCYLEKKTNISYTTSCHTQNTISYEIHKFEKTQNTTMHTIPIIPPNTPSKATLQQIINKRPVSYNQQAHVKRIRKDTFLYNLNEEIDDAQLLTADCN